MPTEPIKSFEQLSRKAATDFLQTVVVVDDQALIHDQGDSENVNQQAVEEEINNGEADAEDDKHGHEQPLTGSNDKAPVPDGVVTGAASEFRRGRKKYTAVAVANKSATDVVSPTRTHRTLNARSLVAGFAENGLVCSVLKPTDANPISVLGNTVKAARRADVVIIDWVMLNRNGDYALEVIEDILRSDGKDRLRLIIVYTGENAFGEIVDKIKNHLTEKLGRKFIDGELNTLLNKAARILVLGKSHSMAPPTEAEKISEEDLPDRVISEFSKMTMGLISNVALNALAFVRLNTHDVLTKLNAKLDASYLSHRALLHDPNDAQEHLVAIIADELRGVLDQFDLSDSIGIDAIEAWLRYKVPAGSFTVTMGAKGSTPIEFDIAQVKDLLQAGIQKWEPTPLQSKSVLEKLRKSGFKTLTSTFSKDADAAADSDQAFSMITALESDYNPDKPLPLLSMGSVLAKDVEKDGVIQSTYWLCVQPLCDSVRLQEPRSFPLLPLIVINDPTKPDMPFDIVVKEKNGEYLHLRLLHKLHECRMVEFTPQNECVRGVMIENGDIVFDADVDKYRWVANLKTRQAQRVLSKYASSAQRIGLNESEWQRRWSGQSED